MFYLVETRYVGPNKHRHRHDEIWISHDPAAPGMHGNWEVVHHGAFETLPDAKAAVHAEFGTARAFTAGTLRRLIAISPATVAAYRL